MRCWNCRADYPGGDGEFLCPTCSREKVLPPDVENENHVNISHAYKQANASIALAEETRGHEVDLTGTIQYVTAKAFLKLIESLRKISDGAVATPETDFVSLYRSMAQAALRSVGAGEKK